MLNIDPNLSLYVKIDCEAFSRHRSPRGVYKVDVVEEKSITHSACAAMRVITDNVAFIDENKGKLTMRVFTSDGEEIIIPRRLPVKFDSFGSCEGRTLDFPDVITIQ